MAMLGEVEEMTELLTEQASDLMFCRSGQG